MNSLIPIILFVAFLIVMVCLPDGFGRNRWASVFESTLTNQDEFARRLYLLRASGVRCRTKTVVPVAEGQQGMAYRQGTARILVRKKDLTKAYAVMSERADE